MSDVQKLKQKSHSKSFEISFGAAVITASRIPTFPMNSIPNAAAQAINIAISKSFIRCISDIIL